jgi:Tol biopolymer transport system component
LERGLLRLLHRGSFTGMKRTAMRATVTGLAALVAVTPGDARAQAKRTGSPEDHLPPQITHLTGFGERAVWSPDGKRIAFMSKSFGDAFEIDLSTRLTRLLTGHFRHAGFLRVHYLPNGDYFLIGAREFKDIRTTRDRDQEMWVMKAGARTPPVALGHRISEGVAVSRMRMRIAWANTRGQYPDSLAEGESVLYMADVVYDSAGAPKLANVKELLRARRPACTLEAQDFRRDDAELVYVCYREGDKADVFGLDLATGTSTTYRKVEGEYNEVEGVSPDGAWALVESSRDQGSDRQDSRHIDLWKLALVPNSTTFVRMTHWGDWDGYKASNPTVSPDGKWFAFQSARSSDPAGVGYGIFLYHLE